jgi:hypothetical protein
MPIPKPKTSPEPSPRPEEPPKPPVFSGAILNPSRNHDEPAASSSVNIGSILLLLGLTVLVAVFSMALTFGTGNRRITQLPQIIINGDWGAVATAALLFYFCRSLAAAISAYGAARRADHRPVPPARWFSTATNNLAQLFSFDFALALPQLVLIAAGTWLLLYGTSIITLAAVQQKATLFGCFFVILYLLFTLNLTARLGQTALALGRISGWHAFTVGLRFAFRHFELQIATIVAAFIELLTLASVLAAIAAIFAFIPANQYWLIAVIGLPLVISGGLIAGSLSGNWWQNTYRRLVRRERLYEALTLLASRHPEKPKNGSIALAASLFILIAGTLAAWPWLP